MGLFTNFNQQSNPDNRYDFLPMEKVDEIIIGATCKHVFKLPFKYSNHIESGVVIYKQGLETGFTITITSDMVLEDTVDSVIIVKLTKDQTKLFVEDKTGQNTKCQLKLVYKNGAGLGYDSPYNLKVFAPLDIHEINDNDLGVHLLAVNTGDSNKVKIQMINKEGVLLEETQDIIIGQGGSGSQLLAVTLVEYENKKQLKFEFADNRAPIYCDIQEIYDKIALKQDLIEDLDTIRTKANSAVQPAALASKQDLLVSGTNIKTINNNSILGSGNIEIQGGGGIEFDDLALYTKYGVFTINGVPYNPATGAEIILTPGSVYKLSGYLKNCHIFVKSNAPESETTTTQLILNGVYIKSDRPQAIYFNQTKKKVAIKVEGNSNNYVIAGPGTVTQDDAFGVIQADGNFVVATGKDAYLNIKTENQYQHGLRGSRLFLSGAGLIEVSAEHDGFHGGKLLRVDSGNYKVTKAGVDGFEAKLLQVFGGNIEVVTCYGDAISSKESKGVVAGYSAKFVFGDGVSLDHRFSNIDILETVPAITGITAVTLQNFFGTAIVKESGTKPVDFPTEAELANWTNVPLVNGKYTTSKQYIYVKGYISNSIITTIAKTKFFADNACLTTANDITLSYIANSGKLEMKGKEDGILMVVNTGSGDAIKSISSVGVQENGNYIFKANTGYTINNINYLFTKGDGAKYFLSEGAAIKAARFTVGADHGDIAEDRKADMFEAGAVEINNKIILTPNEVPYCDGKLYYAYGQIGTVHVADISAIDTVYFWKDTVTVNLIADSANIIKTKDEPITVDAYTKAESDARFVLKSVYDAKIAAYDAKIAEFEAILSRVVEV